MTGDFKEKTALQGKGMLIAAVIVCSSLTFTLGYFVGKIGRDGNLDVSSGPKIAAENAAVPVPVVVRNPHENAEPTKTPEPAAAVAPETHAAPELAKSVIPDRAKDRIQAAAIVSESAPAPVRNRDKQPLAERPAPAVKERKAEVKENAEKAEKEVKYTVQIGAIKSQPEAKKLKQKLAKKGYKAYILVATEKGKGKVYKVRAGEFMERKDADLLALKISKAEGLKTFVTPKE